MRTVRKPSEIVTLDMLLPARHRLDPQEHAFSALGRHFTFEHCPNVCLAVTCVAYPTNSLIRRI